MRIAVLVLCVGSLAMLGCGGITVDTKKGAGEIERDLRAAKVATKSVICPKEVKAEKGKSFACTVQLENGSTEKLRVEMVDDKGGVDYSKGGNALVKKQFEAGLGGRGGITGSER